jgi:hypothetical protein
MKLSQSKLKQIIKEELKTALSVSGKINEVEKTYISSYLISSVEGLEYSPEAEKEITFLKDTYNMLKYYARGLENGWSVDNTYKALKDTLPKLEILLNDKEFIDAMESVKDPRIGMFRKMIQDIPRLTAAK